MKQLIRMLKKEAGQALPMALILLFVGAMVTVVILDLATTNLKATEVIDQKTRNLYAADAGIDDGLWKVRYNYLPDSLAGEWDETTYDQDPYTYVMYDSDNPEDTIPINDRNVEIEIKPIWVLAGLEEPSLEQGRTPDDRLLTYGNIIGDGIYEVSIFQDGSLDPLEIQRIGCWLPPGFEYVDGSSNLEQGAGQPYYCVPDISSHNGGTAITWYYAGIDYDDLPGQGSKRIVDFEFTPQDMTPEVSTDAFCWTRTSRNDVRLSWDTAKKIFEITSTAPSDSEKQTTIVSHSVRKEFQALGGAINGDYEATGITLMRDADYYDYWNMRERLYKETTASMPPPPHPPTDPIPDNATVERIFLYWSGWKCKPWYTWNLTDAQLDALPTDKNVDKIAFRVKVGTEEMPSTLVTATQTQAMRNGDAYSQHGWSYSCFADVTNLVTDYFKDHSVPFYGNATYTARHWDISTEYNQTTYRYRLYDWTPNHQGETYTYYTRYPLGSPMNGGETDFIGHQGGYHGGDYYEDTGSQDNWSYSAWSVVIIYSSPSTTGHHLYVFDEFLYCNSYQTLEFTIKGFLAPEDVLYDPSAARMTCFVGEGDSIWSGDSFKINGFPQSDSVNPANNIWNARSNVLGGTYTDDGIDIDTFAAGGGTIIIPGDTEAVITIPSGTDVWNLIYIMLSFSSEISTGGVIDYSIK
jgi:hypothetical protein